jgi:hypothetical protein
MASGRAQESCLSLADRGTCVKETAWARRLGLTGGRAAESGRVRVRDGQRIDSSYSKRVASAVEQPVLYTVPSVL